MTGSGSAIPFYSSTSYTPFESGARLLFR
uniref:Uncharacterized protein n=1 Tax=Rhizophora mucronata TaxID=61149 RepID=A0A2P2KC08_RHIMU